MSNSVAASARQRRHHGADNGADLGMVLSLGVGARWVRVSFPTPGLNAHCRTGDDRPPDYAWPAVQHALARQPPRLPLRATGMRFSTTRIPGYHPPASSEERRVGKE